MLMIKCWFTLLGNGGRREVVRSCVLTIALGLMVAVLGTGAKAQEKKTPAWPPKTFPISGWCSPPDAFITVEQYRLMADAGLNVVLPTFVGTASVERNRKILDTAKTVGIKAIIADARMPQSLTGNPNAKATLDAIVKDYRKHPALLGYFLTDEPGASSFAGMGEVVAYLKEIDPEHVAYINLFPSYASSNQQAASSQLGTDTYDLYLEKYLQVVKPDVLSYDHYHFLKSGDRPGFIANLASAQRATATGSSFQSATPFWNIVLSVEFDPYRGLTENELRYEAMQTLAFGGKGLVYYTYFQPDFPSYSSKNTIMLRDGTPGALYEPVKRVNREVQALAKWLYGANVLKTYLTGEGTSEGISLGTEGPVRVDGAGNLSIGMFRDGKGYLYVLFTNRDYTKSVATKATLTTLDHPTELLNLESGKWKLLMEKRNHDGEIKVDVVLPPAGAMLVRWK